MRKFTTPNSTLIEKTAGELAATWYEIGRGQGMTSKYKNPRAYARANLEQFIPKAIELLISMLGRPDIPDTMKDEIHAALTERANDPDLAILDAKPANHLANSFNLPDNWKSKAH